MAIVHNQGPKTERVRRKEEILFTKFQQKFKRLGHQTNPAIEARIKEGLSELISVLGTPFLVDPSFKAQQKRRFNTAIRENIQHPYPKSDVGDRSVLEVQGNKVGVFDDPETKDSAAKFNYIGSEFEDWNLEGLFNFDDLDVGNSSAMFLDKYSIDNTSDTTKYSRDEIFNLSLPKEVCKAFGGPIKMIIVFI
ncbi:OLC1v1036486C1 [Oldenlandia corymbosa var. corymbosa]|uniref:OLC1v1036486C1 n=1 Tax=Oldenlandia corymbosa var. corymbosa TaxID=529605 RepID=A0AAV1CVD8_OLDCO|nr:OLC1v1036486C1 [Oldenlandia corymbosa var. corymbosa]